MAKRILIVEDDRHARCSLAFMLQSRGYEVAQATGGAEAFEKATTFSPDLIVLDAKMPTKTGFELCAEFKRDDRYKDIPVILYSGLSEKEQRSDGREGRSRTIT